MVEGKSENERYTIFFYTIFTSAVTYNVAVCKKGLSAALPVFSFSWEPSANLLCLWIEKEEKMAAVVVQNGLQSASKLTISSLRVI